MSMSDDDKAVEEHDEHDGLTFEVVEDEHDEGGRKVRSKGIYLLPNLATTAALCSGFYSIISSMHGNFEVAAKWIFYAAIFDGMDGRLARRFNAQSAFGAEYDSLSDMVSFGVAPAILIYSWSLSGLGRIGWFLAFIHTACAAFRLARFNVQIGIVDKRYFIGLSSPLGAAVVASLVWAGFEYDLPHQQPAFAAVVALIGVFNALLMVSSFKYYSFKELDRSRVPFAVMMPVVLVLGIVAYDLPVGLLSVALVYAASGPVAALWNRRKKPVRIAG
jgi:CDP-diacylglycerol--serine O-phosphatidyltransferase